VWAIPSELAKEIVERDVGSILSAQPREPVAAAPDAMQARHPHDDIRVEGEPVARHVSAYSIHGTKSEHDLKAT
jgi:hypothetical protein